MNNPNQNNKKPEKLTADQSYKINKLGLDEKLFQGSSPLKIEIIDKLYNSEKLKEALYDRDDTDPHFLFLRVLKKKLFTVGAERAPRLIEALENGGPNARKVARRIIFEIDKDGKELNARTEQEYFDRLAEAGEQDAIEKNKIASNTAISQIETNTEQSQISGRIKAITESLPPEKLYEGHIELEALAPEKVEKINEYAKRYAEISSEYSLAFLACMDLATRLKTPQLPPKEKEEIENKISTLEAKKDAFDLELAQIRKNFEPLHKEVLEWSTRLVKQHRQIKRFAERSGINIREVTNIKAWLLDSDTESSFDISPLTGLARKKWGNIEIRRLFFDVPREDDGSIPEDNCGDLTIEFKDQKGKWVTMNHQNFLRYIDALEAYEEVDSMKELNEKVAKHTRYRDLAIGQKFRASILKETIEFTITEIRELGEEPRIVIEPAQLKMPRQWLSKSVDSRLYFDRKQADYSAGEFAKLLTQFNFRRVLDENDSIEEIAAKNKVTLPKNPGESNPVRFYDANTIKRAKITPKADGGYTFAVAEETVALPDREAALDGPNPKPVLVKKWTEKNIPNREAALEMLEDGTIVDETPKQTKKADDVEKGIWISEPPAPAQREEAMPYDIVHKVGGMVEEESNWLSALWGNTKIYNTGDIWELGKTMVEYVERRWDRNRKNRYSAPLKNLPWFGPEMQRINQATENEAVNQFQEALAQMGIHDIQVKMRTTNNRDELKGCFIDMASKGQIRWDDIELWKNINKFSDVKIPIPSNGDPRTQISPTDSRTGFNFIGPAIDSIWGQGGYSSWYSQNKSAFESKSKGYYTEGKELEGIDGGHGRALGAMLAQHKRGEWVDPQRYEGLILHAIDMGKASMQAKIYYMVEGVAAQSPGGETILSLDRMAHINSELLPKFPPLEYITARAARGEGKDKLRFGIDDYRMWARMFDGDDPANCTPNKNVDDFLWKYIIPSDEMEDRVNKAIRNGENMDHDDMFAFVPRLNEQAAQDVCGASAGNKKYLTIEGYANGFPGFSQYLRTVAENNKKNLVMEGIKSYIRYSGILSNRFKKAEGNKYQRFTDRVWDSNSVVSPVNTRFFYNEVNSLIEKIAHAYGDPELLDICDKVFHWKVGDIANPEEKKKQNEIDFAFENFGKVFPRVVKQDEGTLLNQIVLDANLYGMPDFITDEEKAKRKAKLGEGMNSE